MPALAYYCACVGTVGQGEWGSGCPVWLGVGALGWRDVGLSGMWWSWWMGTGGREVGGGLLLNGPSSWGHGFSLLAPWCGALAHRTLSLQAFGGCLSLARTHTVPPLLWTFGRLPLAHTTPISDCSVPCAHRLFSLPPCPAACPPFPLPPAFPGLARMLGAVGHVLPGPFPRSLACTPRMPASTPHAVSVARMLARVRSSPCLSGGG